MSESLPEVYLARHGETAWTVTRQHTGRTDLPLTGAARTMRGACASGSVVWPSIGSSSAHCSERGGRASWRASATGP